MSKEKSKGKVVIADKLIRKQSFIDKDGNEISVEEMRKRRSPLREGTTIDRDNLVVE